jgi:hypothetical protein
MVFLKAPIWNFHKKSEQSHKEYTKMVGTPVYESNELMLYKPVSLI